MRIIILLLLFTNLIYGDDSIEYFKESSKNQLLCHVGQYSFKMVSQKNAEVESIHGHQYFKLKSENLYFLTNACQAVKEKIEIIY